MSCRVALFSVVPSPYQRDLFRALSLRPEVQLQVFYAEAASPDSPWPREELAPYETILPGKWWALGKARIHLNWRLPDARRFDAVVCNLLLSSLTAQWLMRTVLPGRPWLFWGEQQGSRNFLRNRLAAPLRRASGIVSIGTVAMREYRARFAAPAHFNIPYHCALRPFTAGTRHSFSGEPVFLFCGQMIARKGIDLLLEAFARLPCGRLLLVGREADLPALLAPMPARVRERIEYAGFQPPEALPRFFSQADVFVLPSRSDGWGVVVNQALGAGLPIVCAEAVGAGHDLVEDGVNGRRFPTANVDALTTALQRFIDEPELITRWGAASRARAADWTPEVGAGKWIEALQTLGLV